MKNITKLAGKLFSLQHRFGKASFSQCGEDCIVEHMFSLRNIFQPSYIDIGAYHPLALSNTAKFYLKGSRGINIEPNPDQFKFFGKYKRKDINLNIGLGAENAELIYYKMNVPTMNTFDPSAAKELIEKHGFNLIGEIKLPVRTLKEVIDKHAGGKFPDFLSLDVEGLDEEILSQINYGTNEPKIICVETIEYTNDGTGHKNQKIISFLQDKGYILYADTYINSIFVNSRFWQNSSR